jgi:putative endonuclease
LHLLEAHHPLAFRCSNLRTDSEVHADESDVESVNNFRRTTGDRAEHAVAELVASWGWQVLERNVRLGHYEIDIVAREGATLVVIEVRFRGPGSLTSGFGSLSSSKRRRVRFAGERLWSSRYRHDPTLEHVRFDAASVQLDEAGTTFIEYSRAAF